MWHMRRACHRTWHPRRWHYRRWHHSCCSGPCPYSGSPRRSQKRQQMVRKSFAAVFQIGCHCSCMFTNQDYATTDLMHVVLQDLNGVGVDASCR